MCFRPAGAAAQKICPECGMVNPVIATNCLECDAELPEDRVKCPHCGEMNAPDAEECVECGTKLSGAVPPAPGR